MTHDELFEKLTPMHTVYAEHGILDILHALREVAKLHRPYEVTTGAAWTQSNGLRVLGTETLCRHCQEMGNLTALYPCPTIQAIEKALP